MVKVLAQDLVKDQKFHSAYGYAKSTHSECLRSSLKEIMRKDPALVFVMKGKNREDPTLVSKAFSKAHEGKGVVQHSGGGLDAAWFHQMAEYL